MVVRLEDVPFVDDPEIKVDKYETTQMPFRYVKNEKGEPIIPEGMLELIKKDSERGIADLL